MALPSRASGESRTTTETGCCTRELIVPDPPPFSQILPDLVIGACPQTPADIGGLKRDFRVTAVLSLQTGDDHRLYRLDRGMLRRTYEDEGIDLVEVPIRDKDEAALIRQLPHAVTVLDGLLHQKHRVLLHCNIGNGRSPTVAAAWLHWRGGWDLDAAIDHVKRHRCCEPNRRVIEAAQAASGARSRDRNDTDWPG